MARSKYHEAKERKRLRAEAEREKDMIYNVLFQHIDWRHGDPPENRYFPKIRVHSDPDKNPPELQRAIDEFQRTHGVLDWREIAAGHTKEEYWYG